MSDIKVSEKKINSKTAIGTKIAVIENIKYPCFESDGEKLKNVCDKMNAFYEKIAVKYSGYARGGVVKKIKRNMRKCRLPMCMGMKFAVSECKNGIISVVLDLSFSQGKSVRMRRFSQMWHRDTAQVVSVSKLLKLNMKNKRTMYDYVLNEAIKLSQMQGKDYYDDVLLRAKKHFCFGNCFLAPSGVVFFFDAGCLREEKYGPDCFVVPFDKLDGVINQDFIAENTENNDDL